MNDSARKRTSKWDLKEGPQEEVKTEFSVQRDNSETDQKFTDWSDMEDGENNSGSSKAFPQGSQPPEEAFYTESGNKNDSKNSLWNPDGENQSMVKNADKSGMGEGWGTAIKSSMSPGLDPWRQQSCSPSPRGGSNRPSRKRSRTRSKSRSRSRSRSPYGQKHGIERRGERGRTGGVSIQPCRDFSSGRCRRGNQCRFLHEDGDRRHFDRHYHTDLREGRSERAKYHRNEIENDFSDSREHNYHSRNKPSQRQGGGHFDEGGSWEKPDPRRNSNKSTEKCYDFSRGRCQRGANCRFIHHESSSHSGYSIKDEVREPRERERERERDRERERERSHHNSRNSNSEASFGISTETKRVNDEPCKFFAEGRCHRGERCRFSHQNSLVVGRNDDKWNTNHDDLSRNDSSWSDRTAIVDATNSPQNAPPVSHELKIPVEAPGFKDRSGPGLAGPNLGHLSQSQFINPRVPNVQNFSQSVPAMPFNGQMQQVAYPMHPAAQSHFITQQTHPHIGLSQQGTNLGGQISPSRPQSLGQGQQEKLFGGQGLHNLSIQNAKIQQALSSVEGQNQQKVVVRMPQNGEGIKNVQVGKSQFETPHTSSSLEIKLLEPGSGASIAPKVVTSEQAAQITNLSASLAQFFGSAALNAGPMGLVMPLNPTVPSSVSTEQKNPLMEGLNRNSANLVPLTTADGEGDAKSEEHDIVETKQVETNAPSKEVHEKELVQTKEEQNGVPEEANADVVADGENKKSKDSKALKMFKCALVEFVKDILKPSWKEGHLSKEAHKTIVKKVVEKVTGAIQGPNIPQTQEKIDLYLSSSKVKLNKLVQAYVEKYVKS